MGAGAGNFGKKILLVNDEFYEQKAREDDKKLVNISIDELN